MVDEKINEKKIENLLKENKDGLTIQQLSDISSLSRNTITKIIAGLNGKGKLELKKVGMAKLYRWKK